MIRFLAVLLCVLAFTGDSAGQLFRRRYQSCPDGQCQPYVSPAPNGGNRDYPPIPTPVEPKEEAKPEGDGPWAEIPEDMRPRNVSGQCAWDAGESVFGGAGYEEFKGWGRNASRIGWIGGWVDGVVNAAKDRGIETKVVKNKDYSIFDYAKSEGVPVYVQIMVNRPNDHAVCVTGLDENYAYVLDNNGPAVVKKWSRKVFDRVWNGIACCPCHRKNPKTKPEPVKPIEPVKPACPCPPATDTKPITDALSKLTEIATLTNKSVEGLTGKVDGIDKRVGEMDKRLVAVEQKQAAPTASQPALPSTPDPRIGQIQSDLDKLRAALKKGGTLNITVTPQ